MGQYEMVVSLWQVSFMATYLKMDKEKLKMDTTTIKYLSAIQ